MELAFIKLKFQIPSIRFPEKYIFLKIEIFFKTLSNKNSSISTIFLKSSLHVSLKTIQIYKIPKYNKIKKFQSSCTIFNKIQPMHPLEEKFFQNSNERSSSVYKALNNKTKPKRFIFLKF